MQAMKKWLQNQFLWSDSGIIFAIAQDNPATVPPEKCHYDGCCVMEQFFDDDRVKYVTLPAGTYFVCQVPHTIEDVQKQLDGSHPILERYQFSFVENGYCEFCIPIST